MTGSKVAKAEDSPFPAQRVPQAYRSSVEHTAALRRVRILC